MCGRHCCVKFPRQKQEELECPECTRGIGPLPSVADGITGHTPSMDDAWSCEEQILPPSPVSPTPPKKTPKLNPAGKRIRGWRVGVLASFCHATQQSVIQARNCG
ncbi:hypothetical protein CapIbe_016068 [Capra ibex]